VGSLAAMFQARDQLAYRLASIHNLRVLADVANALRQQVLYTGPETAMSGSTRDR
jgi:hypothetical protein